MHAPEPRPVESGTYPAWDGALALLNRDLAATLPDERPLRLLALPPFQPDEPDYVYVALANGEWHGNCLPPESAADPAAALAAVTEAAQDTLTERLWQAWPVCPDHRLGMHPREEDSTLAWWCAGKPGRHALPHLHAPVGALDTTVRPRRPHRKKHRPR
ncbi:hypothetical protein LG634_21050 [Streptomyces bambusae]|uniref:hypothetical protein n=1 Tax=Streptomyces bambusae TaxID=1550616 RepID=UPI001CFC8037|nr:hypothetical protein [Streptomyces bambusae]MCB5167317.1 hypothetical protein [Streptomyces bambusae]